jgi:hypothetical protein
VAGGGVEQELKTRRDTLKSGAAADCSLLAAVEIVRVMVLMAGLPEIFTVS